MFALLFKQCKPKDSHPKTVFATETATISKIIVGDSIATRFPTPKEFKRSNVAKNSFQSYLRNLPLKPEGSPVKYYNGTPKPNPNIYVGVVDLPIGNKNLHQCADAIMRLRAEYLWNQKQFDQIHFNFTNGFRANYSEWIKGMRINIQGNKTWWTKKATPANTYDDFWNYMELIFQYAGTASLEKELQSIPISDAQIGDILIQGGHPGHAVIIVDQAINPNTQEKMFLLAQSYMPAQEIQILAHPNSVSPWYSLNKNPIRTPEWTFNPSDLKRFRE